jgi:hypothetical protein
MMKRNTNKCKGIIKAEDTIREERARRISYGKLKNM